MEKHIEILVDRKEYITKEEAYKVINEQYHETGFDGYQDVIELMNHIAKIPAADVVERKTGKWEIKKDRRRGTAFCSKCNYAYSMGAPFHEYPPKYCPNCGSTMEEGQDE